MMYDTAVPVDGAFQFRTTALPDAIATRPLGALTKLFPAIAAVLTRFSVKQRALPIPERHRLKSITDAPVLVGVIDAANDPTVPLEDALALDGAVVEEGPHPTNRRHPDRAMIRFFIIQATSTPSSTTTLASMVGCWRNSI